ncbi:MAG: nucleoside/nucleotide kinase family protein [Selenomonadaceae bacterium]|nr:nucleoside/nucleotide kinase family protein [Selenomonadaceae bacterium]
MAEAAWRTCRLMMGGLQHKVLYNESTIDNLFMPFLRRLTVMQKRKGRRLVVFLVAPPGTGKTALSLLLQMLSQTSENLTPVQSIGIEGFRHRKEYIRTHSVKRGETEIPMTVAKNAPETFNVEKLKKKLVEVKDKNVRFPVFDRRTQDIVEEVVTIKRDILLVEGNWLLYREGDWRNVYELADYTVFITGEEQQLRKRLIERKMMGGASEAQAKVRYLKHNKEDIDLVLSASWLASETWELIYNGDYKRKAMIKKPVPMVDRAKLWKQVDVRKSEEDIMLDEIVERKRTFKNGMDDVIYRSGYKEGMSAARCDILKKLYASGNITSKELITNFELTPEELNRIIHLDKEC